MRDNLKGVGPIEQRLPEWTGWLNDATDREVIGCISCGATRDEHCRSVSRKTASHRARRESAEALREAVRHGDADPFARVANRLRALSTMKPHLIRPADAPDADTHKFVIDESRVRAMTVGKADCHVYFIRNQAGLIKVGFSSDVLRRLKSLITGAGQMMEFLGAFPGGPEVESGIHFKFASDRVIGEWFQPSDDLLRYLELQIAEHLAS